MANDLSFFFFFSTIIRTTPFYPFNRKWSRFGTWKENFVPPTDIDRQRYNPCRELKNRVTELDGGKLVHPWESRVSYILYTTVNYRVVFLSRIYKRIVSLHKIDIISFFKFPLSIESKWGSWFHSLERKFSIDPFQMQILIEDVLQRLTKRSCNTDRARFVSLVLSLIIVFQRVVFLSGRTLVSSSFANESFHYTKLLWDNAFF